MEVREPSAKYLARAGFKQTDVGMIPADWLVQQIGDFQPFVTSGSRGWAPFYSSYGSLFVRITNLTRERIYLDLSDVRFVNLPAASSEGRRTQLRQGDVLISITADIGIVGYVTEKIPTPAYINQHIALVRFDPDRVHSRYVTYFLASERVQKLFRSLTDSGAKAGMNLATVRQVKFAVPDTLAEQQAIATALSDADALIESLEQLLTKKRQIKQGAMQELLTAKRRLPGFEGAWSKRSLGELLSIRHGRGQKEVEVADGPYPVLATGGQIGTANRFLYDKPSVLIGRKGTINQPQFMDTPFWTVDTLFYSEVSAPNSAKFLFYRFGLIDWMQYNEASGVPSLNARTIEAVEVLCPGPDEQSAIATILSDMDADISAVEAKLTKARAIKQGMMQELLTGRIRLV